MAGARFHPGVSGVLGWLVIAGLACLWLVLARPVGLGGATSYVKVSGTSMEPSLHTGDLAILRQAAEYEAGDVVAYRVPRPSPVAGEVVIHRIARVEPDGSFVMQGDNNDSIDPWRPRASDVLGRMFVSVPRLGYVFDAFGNPALLAALMFGFTFLIVMTAGSQRRPGATA